MKVASGGELSRFLLALKVSLADRGSAPTLVFDEIDSGVGGAVSDAIGQRLKRLAGRVQVLSVTHAPQVAARADEHYLISKSPARNTDEERVATAVSRVEGEHRRGGNRAFGPGMHQHGVFRLERQGPARSSRAARSTSSPSRASL